VTDAHLIPPVVSIDEVPSGAVLADVRWYLDGRSGRAAYDAGHLPGAVFVDLDEHLAAPASADAGRHPLPTPEDFAASMGSLGIRADDVVVAYDDAGGTVAARLAWMLRVLGRRAAVLDGGLAAWPGPLSQEAVARPPVEVEVEPWPADAIASIEEVAARPPENVLVDVRAGERYLGEVEPIDPRAGHIPGARSVPFSSNLGDDSRFRPPPELRASYAAAGVESADRTIVYCGSGVTACHGALAMERAGIGRPRVYIGSWSQWSADPKRPAATGPGPE
jgi:thiosulfate/3-mercaptopyruvate sulfurtransferase